MNYEIEIFDHYWQGTWDRWEDKRLFLPIGFTWIPIVLCAWFIWIHRN